ncbi:MAG: myo-inositol-1(or 4)-monophosphatase [Parcubacteria bacterium C7867-008]|nr:MAG: myo-inositol-1(or 4)-monophosphatase [Parcubacteria bacterium C7867-008]
MDEQLKIAKEIALEAGVVMTQYFELGMRHTFKDDHSPLTKADELIQELVIKRLSEAYPEHSLLGEEGKQIQEGSTYTWVFDPIDGTAAFLRGVPTNVFSLGLTENGVPVLGVVYDPYTKRLYSAVRGQGACMNDVSINASSHADLARSYIATDGHSGFKDLTFFERARIERVRCLSYSSTVYASMMVASGQLQGVVLPLGNPWDSAAAKVIVEEAGGVTSDLYGNDQRYDTQTKGFVCAGNANFHSKLLELIAPSI